MASVPKRQGRLFRKYVVFFAVLVSGALLTSGLVQLYFSYQENQTTVVSVQRAKAVTAASTIEQFVREAESQIGWVTAPPSATGPLSIEQRQNDGGTRPERRRASQSQVGGNAGGQCRGRQRDRHLAPQRDAAGPAAPLARQSHAVLPAELGAEIASSTIFPRACRTAILPAT